MKPITLLFALGISASYAATITVINTNDSGPGSLRQAIIDASPGDTVDFDLMMLYSGSVTIDLNSEIAFNKAIVIDGYYTSTDSLFVSGQGTNRIFNISNSAGIVELNGLSFIQGASTDGGALYKSGGGQLTIDDCNFLDNFASNYGGAFYKNNGYLLVNECHFSNNSATSDGGAIYLSPSGINDFQYTTFFDNSTGTEGGAIFGFVAHSNFDQCTFTGNSAVTEGGAIYDWGSAVIMNVTNCTFVGNSAASSAGIDFWGSSVVFTAKGSIFAGNIGTTNLDIWGAGAIANSNGYNIFGDATYAGAVGTDQLGVSPAAINLGALIDNGGTTFTLMPDLGSVAIDNGDGADLVDAQNGVITDGTRDIGAAESYSCPDIYSAFYDEGCAMYTVPSGDETYSLSGTTIVYDTIPTACGSDSIMTIIVVIGDLEAPVPDISVLPDFSEQCEATLTAPTATDECEGSILGTTGTVFPITTPGTTVVTWTFDDGNGNISTQDQNVNITGLDLSVTQTGFTLTSNSTGSTYQWVDCNQSFNTIPGETNVDFTPSSNGSYAVIVTNGSCVDTSACIDITGIGFEENGETSFVIYPNPTSGSFNISTTENDVYLTLKSSDGKTVMPLMRLEKNEKIDVSGITSGFYLVELNSSKGKFTRPIVIQ